jgi:hypothetical protein
MKNRIMLFFIALFATISVCVMIIDFKNTKTITILSEENKGLKRQIEALNNNELLGKYEELIRENTVLRQEVASQAKQLDLYDDKYVK